MSMPPQSSENRIPQIPGAIERVELLKRLEYAIQVPLTLISAPPGYGKTTTVAQFAVKTPHAVAWHAISQRERDVPNLYAHSLAALESVAPGISRALPEPGDRPSAELAALIAEHLREHLSDDVFYILDDVHHLSGSPGAQAWLRALPEKMPKSCHLILLSRTIPDLPLFEMVARSEVLAFGQEDLRLSDEEIERLAYQLMAEQLASNDMRSLFERLDGWPAGVMLALQPLPSSLDTLGAALGPEALFEALARSMLNAQLPDLRHFLLVSSTLPRLTPELCKNVLGLANSAEWLALAQTRNLFLTRVGGGLVYHTLFRNFLQREFRRVDPGLFTSLHLEAARWFEARDEIEEAFDQYLEAGEVESARDLAERVATSYFAQGRFETMLGWNRQLTEAGLLAPLLAHECAMIYTDRYEYDAAEAELERARQGFTQQGNDQGLVRVRLQQAWVYAQKGAYQQARELAAPIADSDQPELRGRALRVLGLTRVRLGDVTAGVECLEQALELYKVTGLVSSLSHLLQDLYFAYTRLGRLDEAGNCLQEVVTIRRRLGGAGSLALALNNLGYYYHQRSDYRQAEQTLEEALNVIRGISDRRAESALLWSLGDLKRDLGVFNEAQRLYDKALELSPADGDPSLYSSILVSASTLRRWQDRPSEAALLAEEAQAVADAHGIVFEAAMARAVLWAARARLGDAQDAQRELEGVTARLGEQGARFELAGVEGLRAGIYLMQGDMAAAGCRLREALRVAEVTGTAQPLAAEVAHNPALDAFIAEVEGYDLLLRDLGRLREAQTEVVRFYEAGNGRGSPATFSLRIVTLGQETVERDGVPIPPSDWRASAARELFFYLLFAGPKTRSEIGLVFWPDGSADQVRASFHTTLHRARAALGNDVILFHNEQYFINPDLAVWCDASQMEDAVAEARLLPPHDPRAADQWRRAVSLYNGDFLPSLDTEWASLQRERLREMALEALIGSGHCARALSDHRAALDWYAKALEMDPYREDIHRAVMRCYAEMGERSQVLATYNNLVRLLHEELGVEPSNETTALARELLD